jgi:hypothetical protein
MPQRRTSKNENGIIKIPQGECRSGALRERDCSFIDDLERDGFWICQAKSGKIPAAVVVELLPVQQGKSLINHLLNAA